MPATTLITNAFRGRDLRVDACDAAVLDQQVRRLDPVFVDLGGVFDVGQTRSQYGMDPSIADNARDAVAGFNVHSLALQIPIEMLQKDGKTVDQAADILDPDFVIDVFESL